MKKYKAWITINTETKKQIKTFGEYWTKKPPEDYGDEVIPVEIIIHDSSCIKTLKVISPKKIIAKFITTRPRKAIR